MTRQARQTAAFLKRLRSLDGSKDDREKFRDFLELSYCAVAKLTAAPERAETLEDRYMSVVRSYLNKDDVRAYPELLAIAACAAPEARGLSLSSNQDGYEDRHGPDREGPARPFDWRCADESRTPGPRGPADGSGLAQPLPIRFQPPSFKPSHRRRPGNRHTDDRFLIRSGQRRSAANRLIESDAHASHSRSRRVTGS